MSSTCARWASTDDICPPCDQIYDLDVTELEEQLEVASDLLFLLSGSRWPGVCSRTVRPQTNPATGELYYTDGHLRASCGYNHPNDSRISEIGLGVVPIVDVTQVRVRESKNGTLETLIDSTDYRIDDRQWLVRLGSGESWPIFQDMLQGAGGDGVFFEVVFTFGEAPPIAGVKAAAELGCELALGCNPDTASLCKLPAQTITQISRQGVTMALVQPNDLSKDLTGLPLTDLFLRAYNPAGLRRPPVVVNPAHVRPWRQVST